MKARLKARRIAGLVMASGLMLLPAGAWAQTAASGSIAGVVRDTTGGVLPGVTVEAASPALIEKVRLAVTDGEGRYQIIDLRPGLYSVTFTMEGFAPLRREGIDLATGFTATVNAELRVGTLAETVTVTGESPVVDVRTASPQKTFDQEFTDTLPVGQNLGLYATLIPGVGLSTPARQDVGGTQGEQSQAFMIHGGRRTDFVTLKDGLVAQNHYSGGGSNCSGMNPASTEEVMVQLGGGNAENMSGGIYVNVVPKEGGNTFSGTFQSTFGDENLQGTNLTDELRARGVPTPPEIKTLYEVTGGVGGPIRRDKVWFYAGARRFTTSFYVPGNYYNKLQGTLFYEPDLSRQAYSNDYYNEASLRLTWQAAERHKVNLTYIEERGSCNCFWAIQAGTLAPEATGDDQYAPNYKVQAKWSHTAGNRVLLEAGVTVVRFRINRRLTGGTHDDVPIIDLDRNYRYGNSGFGHGITTSWGTQRVRQSNEQFTVAYVTGSHAFKAGFYHLWAWRQRLSWFDNDDMTFTFRTRTPVSLTLWATPYDAEEHARNVAMYAQDQWTKGRLTLSAGLRFDAASGWVPARQLAAGRWVDAREWAKVEDVPNWKDVVPRAGIAYDLFGDARTAVKASLGRYVAYEYYGVAGASNPINSMVNSATRTWNDLNQDYRPDCDMRNPVANGECGPLNPTNFGQSRITTRFADDVRAGWGNRNYNWQTSVSLQRELRPGIALNVGYFRTWYGNFTVTDNLEWTPADYDQFCITTPLDARLPGGGGERICGLYDITPAKFGRTNNVTTQASQFGDQSEVYNGLDLTIDARLGNGRQISGGLNTGRTVTDSCLAVDSPDLRFCRQTLPFAAQTQVKLSGVYPLPWWGLRPSATLQNMPGAPITATYVASNAAIAPSLGRNLAAGVRGTYNVELIEPNTRREPRWTQLDLRIARVFRRGRVRAEAQFDAYNVLNASPVLLVQGRYGPAWQNALAVLPARMFKFGVEVDF